MPPKTADEEAEEFNNVAFLKLLYFMNTRQDAAFERHVQNIEAGINKYKAKLSKGREITFYYNISIYFFALEHYQLADYWSKKILDMNGIADRKDIQLFIRIFQLIIYFELEYFSLIGNLQRSIYRGLKKDELLRDFERIMLNFLKKAEDFETLGHKVNQFEKVKKKLNELQKQDDFKPFIGLDVIFAWVESHITGMKFLDIMEKGVQGKA